MHSVEIFKEFTHDKIRYKPGRFIMPEDIEHNLRLKYGNYMGMSRKIAPNYKGEDLTNKSILVFRLGGIGDMMFLLPVLQHIKRKFPTCKIDVCTATPDPLMNCPEISNIYQMPFSDELIKSHDYYMFFQGIIEMGSDLSRTTHAVDLFYKYMGIDYDKVPAEDKVPKLHFTMAEYDWLAIELKKLGIPKDHQVTDKYVVGIQLETSSVMRNYSTPHIKTVIDTLAKESDTVIVLIGNTPQQKAIAKYLKGDLKNVLPLMDYSVRQHINLAQRYDLIISPDSFMVQVAGALSKPQIGLYGPFSADLRMRYFKNAVSLEWTAPCSPCCTHSGQPCTKGYPSPCMRSITADNILQAATEIRLRHCGEDASFKYSFRVYEKETIHVYH